jgi:hypothetical protein
MMPSLGVRFWDAPARLRGLGTAYFVRGSAGPFGHRRHFFKSTGRAAHAVSGCSLVPQRHHRIDFRGPACGQIARKQCHCGQQKPGSYGGSGIGRRHLK